MFGYVRPQKFELLVREYDEYRGVYCSLCKELGKRYGLAARLSLNYDCTFYAVLMLSVRKDGTAAFTKGRCCVNPLKKCYYCRRGGNGDIFADACALTVILTYYKLLDNIHDSGAVKKFLYGAVYPLAARKHKKAAAGFPEFEGIVSGAMETQAKIEKSDKPGIDLCAHPTAEMISRILEVSAGKLNTGESTARIFRSMGYNLGRWIYLIDAADDLESDIASGSFNPFAVKFSLGKKSGADEISAAKKYANGVLNMSLSQIAEAADLLGLNSLGSITRNVILKGLPQMQKELLFKKEKTNVGPI